MKKNILYYTVIVIITLIIIIYMATTKFTAEYEKTIGSSEKLWNSSNYKTAIEINIPTGPKFFMVINEEEIMTNIFIENEEAIILANKDIEGKKLVPATESILDILLENNSLDKSLIEVINYNDNNIYNKCIDTINNKLTQNNKTIEIIKTKKSLNDKITEENLDVETEDDLLWLLYLRSTDLIEKSEDNNKEQTTIDQASAEVYANEIYQKLTTYMFNANVTNQTKDDTRMPIQYIPGNTSNTVYATSDSWYYIENSKIYAQINIETYKFCYNGSIENRKEGTCS